MPPKPVTRSNEANEEGDSVSQADLQKFEVTIQTLLEKNQSVNNANIDKNAKSISELSDLVTGLSLQITKLITEKGAESPVNHSNTALSPHHTGNGDKHTNT